MVIGGFAQDSDRDDVTSLIEKHVISETDEAVEEIYAYTFGSIGFIRFVSIDSMRTFLKKFGARPRPNVGGTTLWATQSKNPGERRKSKHLGKHKRVLIEVGLAKSDDQNRSSPWHSHGKARPRRRMEGRWRGWQLGAP